MDNTSTKIIFFGNERLVSGLKETNTPVLRGLIARGYNVVAVVSHHSESKSRNQRPLEVAEIAKQHNIPVLLPNRPADILDDLAALKADVAILVAYGRIIPQRVIDIFPKGIINIHPSLLPKYRGPTPIESAIASGDTETGVSIMQLTAGMDSGPVYARSKLPLTGTETKFEVYNSLAQQGAELLFEILPRVLKGSLQPVEQNEHKATYCQLLQKEDGFLKPEKFSAIQAERQIRAYLNHPKMRYTISNQQIIITKAHVSSKQKTPLDILCKDGAFLSIDELIAPSGRAMDSEAFLRGYAT